MVDRLSLDAILMSALAGVMTLPMACAAQTATDNTGTVAQSSLQSPGDALGAPDERPTKEPAPMAPTRPQSEKAGLKLGSFRFFPGLSISSLYDDNIFATRNDPQHGVVPQSDLVTVISPTAVLKSNWARNQLDLDAGADFGRYRTHTQENYQDAWLGIRGRYDLSNRSNVFAGARISRNHEERGSLDAVQGIEPTVYTELQSHLGFARRFDRTSLRLGGTFEKLNFDNVPGTNGGIINNDLRDRKLYTLGTRISYRLTPRFSPFLQAALDRRRYDTTPPTGFDRDSNGTRLDLGVLLRMANGVHGEAYVGHLTQNYDDPRLADVSKPDFGARLRWRAPEHTNVTAYLDRSMEETVLAGTSGYLNTVLGAKVEHRLRPRLRLNVRASVGRSEYQGIDRNENLLVAGAGLKYDLSRYLYLGADYRFLHRDSNLPSDVFGTAYYRNQVMLTLGSQLLAARPPEAWSGEAATPARGHAPASPAGFYFGGQVGYGALNAVTSGSRGEGEGEDESAGEGAAENVDVGNMGSHGADAGLFAGYGWLIKRWYLGLELEGDRSRAEFYHFNSKSDSRTFSLERTVSYGLSARLGYALSNGTLLYGRLGTVRTRFQTPYLENDLPASASDSTDTQRGTRYGVGVDIPTGSPLFWRMDYAYTRYNSYPVYYGGAQAERFSNSGGLFRLGLGWHFGATRNIAPVQPATRVAGLYLGAAIGQGSLDSHVTGLQRTQGQGPYQFNADFGNDGVSSTGFIGYGWTFHRVYAGVELTGEGSRTTWNHIREIPGSGGRNFSVEKQGGYGAALRLGYVLNNGTLLYTRFGRVHTKFSTRYDKGANPGAYIYDDNHETGTRLGVGADIPVGHRLFVRADYSFTRYPSYGFTTTQGGGVNADQLAYKNTESLFRVGLGLRF